MLTAVCHTSWLTLLIITQKNASSKIGSMFFCYIHCYIPGLAQNRCKVNNLNCFTSLSDRSLNRVYISLHSFRNLKHLWEKIDCFGKSRTSVKQDKIPNYCKTLKLSHITSWETTRVNYFLTYSYISPDFTFYTHNCSRSNLHTEGRKQVTFSMGEVYKYCYRSHSTLWWKKAKKKNWWILVKAK